MTGIGAGHHRRPERIPRQKVLHVIVKRELVLAPCDPGMPFVNQIDKHQQRRSVIAIHAEQGQGLLGVAPMNALHAGPTLKSRVRCQQGIQAGDGLNLVARVPPPQGRGAMHVDLLVREPLDAIRNAKGAGFRTERREGRPHAGKNR